MSPYWHELPISLDKLDDHLKALLRLKIREFVHLSPWFKNTTDVDLSWGSSVSRPIVSSERRLLADSDDCPHRKQERQIGRRHVRSSLHIGRV